MFGCLRDGEFDRGSRTSTGDWTQVKRPRCPVRQSVLENSFHIPRYRSCLTLVKTRDKVNS